MQQLPPAKRRRIRQIRDHQTQLQSIIGLKLVKLGFSQLRLRNFHLHKLHFSQYKPAIRTIDTDSARRFCIGQFSISHSQNCICCVLSRNKQVGIDVEKIRPLSLNLMTKYQLGQNDFANRLNNTLAPIMAWTQKEAIFKVIGNHQLHELKHISLTQTTANQCSARFKNQLYHINSYTIARQYAMSIASLQPNTKIKIKRVYF